MPNEIAATREGPLRVGVFESAASDRELFTRGLAEATGLAIVLDPQPSYRALVDGLAARTIDLAWLPPVAYVKAQALGAAFLVATTERGGAATYGCAVLAREPGDLASARGKRVVWADPWSASGYVVPRALLRQAKIDPEADFAEKIEVRGIRDVLAALREGRADVGGVHCRTTAAGTIASGPWSDADGLTPIAVGGPIPCDALCVGASVPLEERRALRAKLTAKHQPEALLGALEATGLRDPDVRWYDIFRLAFLRDEPP